MAEQDSPKYYTATGDDGMTSLLGDQRVKKYHPQPMCYGDVDEAQSALGVARAIMQDEDAAQVVLQTQRDLYHLMSELAATPENQERFRKINADRVVWLEKHTDFYGSRLNLPREFVISGDSAPGAALDYARTVVRRAERSVVKLDDDGTISNPELGRYMNRLSSLCFVLARYEDALSGQSKVTLAKDVG
ncbi:MAG: cob(I)yrinic acid a,c-diamide adenosyltransferase [Chloroflexi bacterium]|nr:cob(I)yrinic acid a,c-diamide adenosyltransferase [Chloroflexota bacterium]